MEIVKQYICQCITTASNNLRLNSQQIEVVALLREVISESSDVERDIKNMKRITEFSTLAIRLNEIYNFLTGRVDILKLSDQFKIHSSGLIKDLTHMLDTVTPRSFKAATQKLENLDIHKSTLQFNEKAEVKDNSVVNVDLSKRRSSDDLLERQSESIKEKLILDDEKEDEEAIRKEQEEIRAAKHAEAEKVRFKLIKVHDDIKEEKDTLAKQGIKKLIELGIIRVTTSDDEATTT